MFKIMPKQPTILPIIYEDKFYQYALKKRPKVAPLRYCVKQDEMPTPPSIFKSQHDLEKMSRCPENGIINKTIQYISGHLKNINKI